MALSKMLPIGKQAIVVRGYLLLSGVLPGLSAAIIGDRSWLLPDRIPVAWAGPGRAIFHDVMWLPVPKSGRPH